MTQDSTNTASPPGERRWLGYTQLVLIGLVIAVALYFARAPARVDRGPVSVSGEAAPVVYTVKPELTEHLHQIELTGTVTLDRKLTVVSEVVAFIASGIPGASLLDGVIAEQVVKLLTWEFSDPVKTGDENYSVLATVSTSVELDLPVVGEKGYKASLPFNLRVDAGTGEVTGWSPDVSQADVSEVE